MAATARKTLDRLLSRAGCCSRQQARERIAAGAVRVNGRTVRDPDTWVDPGRDDVLVDGAPLRARRREVWALHKPVGCVTTADDEHGRHTVYDLLPAEAPWLAPVGRLDRDSSGLLLFTNDSELAHAITAPASKLPKVYEVRVKGRVADDALHALRSGIALHDGITRPARVEVLAAEDRATTLRIVLTEGRNRQIRRMALAIGSRVHALHRVQIGPLRLGDLPVGAARRLSAAEVRALRAAVSGAAARPSRARAR
jgi:23S rRNA pseudouridine2605 synthase